METHYLSLDNNQQQLISNISSDYPYILLKTDMTHYEVPWHWHEEFEISYVLEGAMRVMTEKEEYLVRKGEICFYNSDVLASNVRDPSADILHVAAHLFHPIFIYGHFHSLIAQKYVRPVMTNRQIGVVVVKPETPRGREICRKVLELTDMQERKDVELQTRGLLSEIWLLLLEEIHEILASRPMTDVSGQGRIRQMLHYIHLHYGEKISLEEIAGSANIGERECLRTFKKTIGKTPFDYLNEYRLSRARDLLSETDISITEIAQETGFSDSAYFGKQFRRQYCCTPSQYRKTARQGES